MGAHIAHQQGVAVRSRLGNGVGPHHAASTAPVVHHHRLAPLQREFLRHQTRTNIGTAAWGKRHDDGDRFGGVVLGPGRPGGQQGRQGQLNQGANGQQRWSDGKRLVRGVHERGTA